MDESGGEEPAAPEEEETPCVPCEAAAEDETDLFRMNLYGDK